MNLEELIVRLRIEEDNRSSKKKVFNPNDAKANIWSMDKAPKIRKPS